MCPEKKRVSFVEVAPWSSPLVRRQELKPSNVSFGSNCCWPLIPALVVVCDSRKESLLIVLALLIDVALVLALEWEVVGLGTALVEGDQEVGTEITVAERKTSILHFLLCGGHGRLLLSVEWREGKG